MMNNNIKNLKGSEKRDMFKWAHKNKMGNAPFYASDADLCLIMDRPNRGVVAYLDYKGSNEGITFTEKILYDEWTQTKPVYIVEGSDPENGPFVIKLYCLGGETKFICKAENWQEFTLWEAGIRRTHAQRKE
jgi:hypothetical protein